MKIHELATPSFLVDLDILERNIRFVQKFCNDNDVELWPMIKTHKSMDIANIQLEEGAKGFLTGTLDEAYILSENGVEKIIYAYPVSGKANIDRVIDINRKTELYISLDNKKQFKDLNNALIDEDDYLNIIIIVNSGLNRFGVEAEDITELLEEMKYYNRLIFKGISTHPGHVYSAQDMDDIEKCANDEIESLKKAKENIEELGYEINIVATGSTPTMFMAGKDKNINILRPGNYVFNDNIQISTGFADEDHCSLTILASVISKNSEYLMIDAGSKTLGLDKGAHGVSNINGYGYIKGYKDLIITDLSEEVAKVKIDIETDLDIGDKIQIIPNHSCSAANMTDYLIGYRDDIIEKNINIDMRNGKIKRWEDI